MNISNFGEFVVNNKKDTSPLSKHILQKKTGILASPWNHSMREANINMGLNSWSRDRLPEYLWLGLILVKHGRKEAFNKLFPVLNGISKIDNSLMFPRISEILKLDKEKQERVFFLILQHLDKTDISPLTVVLSYSEYPLFYEYFNERRIPVEKKLKTIRETIKVIWAPQSNEATDLRYLALCLSIYNQRIQFGPQTKNTILVLSNYPHTDHDNQLMRSYRPVVRSMEGIDFGQDEYPFSKWFWKELGLLDDCNVFFIEHDKEENMEKDLIGDLREALDYTFAAQKESALGDSRFEVFNGSICYALKVYEEVIVKDLANSILGRHGIRTIIELYIILKYLIKGESNNATIWDEYIQYGIGKYKLILLKSREKQDDEKSKSHFTEVIADLLVNELLWEEFQDVDFKYFDKQGIREKSQAVGEKDLYDVLYDYDSGYVHGLWGAIRESSMLNCDNPNHGYHIVPDIHNSQNQKSVLPDMNKYFKELINLYHSNYQLPDWFEQKYLIGERD